MNILKVIHGYPPAYNAGSEVYTQALCQELAKRHKVSVFCREENLYAEDYAVSQGADSQVPAITLQLVNLPRERQRDRYLHKEIADIFDAYIAQMKPDLIHFGHLNHLSTSMVDIAHQHNIPTVFTLHDFWLMCPRGQFVQRNSKAPYTLCSGQEDQRCAAKCYAGSHSGSPYTKEEELSYWTNWVSGRMDNCRELSKKVDLFIAPSRHLMDKFTNEFGISPEKIQYLDYGFDLSRLQGRVREKNEPITFGYIGTHIPSKGIQDLIQAVGYLPKSSQLKIWGRHRSETTPYLKKIAQALPNNACERVKWMEEYRNEDIVSDVFNKIDVLVVPSIWLENSPLVIHEAQQLGIPVITANMGGMAEYVHHEVNGLLFTPRDVVDLSAKMHQFIDRPQLIHELGQRRYLYSQDGNIPSMGDHANRLEIIYDALMCQKQKINEETDGPWRITFDTNPHHCNYKCIMCECFSPFSHKNEERVEAGRPRTVMDISLIRKTLEEQRGAGLKEIIPSTMGEPLLYKDFDQLIELCQEFDLKLNLTTNGSFPIQGAESWARKITPVASDIKISWNGATKSTQEAIMLGSNWEGSLDNLKILLGVRDEVAAQGGNRATITLQLTFLESNIQELSNIVQLAIDLGIDRIKGHHLWAHFDEIKDLSMRRNIDSITRWNIAVKEAQDIVNKQKHLNQRPLVLENINILELEAVENLSPGGECPFLGKEAWIDPVGNFHPCCAPDDLRKSLGDFGNINERSLKSIWNSPEYNALKRNYMDYPLCRNCNMRKPAER